MIEPPTAGDRRLPIARVDSQFEPNCREYLGRALIESDSCLTMSEPFFLFVQVGERKEFGAFTEQELNAALCRANGQLATWFGDLVEDELEPGNIL